MKKKIFIIFFLMFSFLKLSANSENEMDMSYSLNYPNYEKFVNFIKKANLNQDDLDIMYKNCDTDPKAALVCAMAYDYGYGESNSKIQKWYLLAADSDIQMAGRSAKYEYADYMARIGKPGFVDKFFKPGECYTRRNKGACFYYLGIARYNENHNDCRYLHQASRLGTKKNLVERLCDK